jgi:hypothetical protein
MRDFQSKYMVQNQISPNASYPTAVRNAVAGVVGANRVQRALAVGLVVALLRGVLQAWEKQVLSAEGFKRVGSHSE